MKRKGYVIASSVFLLAGIVLFVIFFSNGEFVRRAASFLGESSAYASEHPDLPIINFLLLEFSLVLASLATVFSPLGGVALSSLLFFILGLVYAKKDRGQPGNKAVLTLAVLHALLFCGAITRIVFFSLGY
ncbi:MAG: hypothetical protein HUJ60_02155 [Bacilli bacterium]|nr:hypothetical protein [Bacilli bacterium]